MRALILMSRIPIAGKTKTRLIGNLSPQQVANLHYCFLQDIALELEFLFPTTDLFVNYGHEGKLDNIKDIFDKKFFFLPQKGDSLGEKMANAFQILFAKGYKKILLMGADCLQCTHQELEQAFDCLQSNDIVLGPTIDGGYYLVGLKRFYALLFFDNILWGTPKVFLQTMQKINDKKVFFLAKKRDIDTPQDLQFFFKKEKNRNRNKNTLKYLYRVWKN